MARTRLRSARGERRSPSPLDAERLEELALAYVARFATSTGRLRAYCTRKLRERGHVGAEDDLPPPDVDALVARFTAEGYVDDASYARAKTNGLLHRGYGARRVGDALRADGIGETLRADLAPHELQRRQAAVAYARRRRFGPFSRQTMVAGDRQGREKQLAALLRAGHDPAHARQVVAAMSEDALEDWIGEAREEEHDAR